MASSSSFTPINCNTFSYLTKLFSIVEFVVKFTVNDLDLKTSFVTGVRDMTLCGNESCRYSTREGETPRWT